MTCGTCGNLRRRTTWIVKIERSAANTIRSTDERHPSVLTGHTSTSTGKPPTLPPRNPRQPQGLDGTEVGSAARKCRKNDHNLPLTVRLLVAFNPLRWPNLHSKNAVKRGALTFLAARPTTSSPPNLETLQRPRSGMLKIR